jgi:hypothetical protein
VPITAVRALTPDQVKLLKASANGSNTTPAPAPAPAPAAAPK